MIPTPSPLLKRIETLQALVGSLRNKAQLGQLVEAAQLADLITEGSMELHEAFAKGAGLWTAPSPQGGEIRDIEAPAILALHDMGLLPIYTEDPRDNG